MELNEGIIQLVRQIPWGDNRSGKIMPLSLVLGTQFEKGKGIVKGSIRHSVLKKPLWIQKC